VAERAAADLIVAGRRGRSELVERSDRPEHARCGAV